MCIHTGPTCFLVSAIVCPRFRRDAKCWEHVERVRACVRPTRFPTIWTFFILIIGNAFLWTGQIITALVRVSPFFFSPSFLLFLMVEKIQRSSRNFESTSPRPSPPPPFVYLLGKNNWTKQDVISTMFNWRNNFLTSVTCIEYLFERIFIRACVRSR